ncbi:type IV pilin N-terminal domain-containing protein [Halospeciosus flavus]|uniref:Type IV pilin N-terminal domain-containing protein n=1 Tax=Halospeciosus flavus TaxID=3032283 RepID=A0ABD5Z127_9EURY|nr:type IV pilin N-terminal domain-containing protein [Halospeciosus flavus]
MTRVNAPNSGDSTCSRGASSVLGTTILIAITVVLVFSVGTFVVGVDTPSGQTPTTVVEATYDDSSNELVLHHRAGDTLSDGDLVVRNESTTLARTTPTAFGVGQTISVPVEEKTMADSERIEVLWVPDGSGANRALLVSTSPPKVEGYDGPSN